MFYFHIRRFDGVLEHDEFGLELAQDDLVREADAGARGLVIESIAEATSLPYRRFEVADSSGRTVLEFDFALALRTVACAQTSASHYLRQRPCDGPTYVYRQAAESLYPAVATPEPAVAAWELAFDPRILLQDE